MDPVVVHVIVKGSQAEIVNGLPGLTSISLIYLSNLRHKDPPSIQLQVSAKEDPAIAQIGPLIANALAATEAEMASLTKPSVAVSYSRGTASELFKRSVIVQTDYGVYCCKPAEKSPPGCAGSEPQGSAKTPSPVAVKGEATYSNTPLTRYTFHAGAGIFVGPLHGDPPAKVDSNTYVSDPVNRAITFAGVAIHKKFDSTAAIPTRAEKIAFITAAVLTPAAGLYAGPSVGWRGFAFTGGYAAIWVHNAPMGSKLGDPVKPESDGGPKEQLVLRPAHGIVVGATYVFGS
jgi:hypothetical protein